MMKVLHLGRITYVHCLRSLFSWSHTLQIEGPSNISAAPTLLGQVTISLPMRGALEPPWLPSKPTTTLWVFLSRMLSFAFTLKQGLSTQKVNCVVCENTFLNGIEVVTPALTE